MNLATKLDSPNKIAQNVNYAREIASLTFWVVPGTAPIERIFSRSGNVLTKRTTSFAQCDLIYNFHELR